MSFSAVGLGIGYCAVNKAGSRGMLCCIFRAVSVCVESVDCKTKLRVQNCEFFFRRLRRAFHFGDFTFGSGGSRKVTTLAGRVVNRPRVHKSHVVNRAKQVRLRFLDPSSTSCPSTIRPSIIHSPTLYKASFHIKYHRTYKPLLYY